MLTIVINILKLANRACELNELPIIPCNITDILAEFLGFGKSMVQIDLDLLNGIYFVFILVSFLP